MRRRVLPGAGLHLFAVKPAGLCRACRVRRCRIVEGSSSARVWRGGIGAAPHHGRMYAPKPKEFTMAHDAPKQDSIDANVPMTTSGTPTEWEQRRQLVQAIMGSLMSILDKGSGDGLLSLRDIFEAIDVTLDTIRARVAHQAFAGGPSEAFWPPMQALLDSFYPELGSL